MKFSIKILLYVKKFSYVGIAKLAELAKVAKLAKLAKLARNQLTNISKLIGITKICKKPVNQN